MNNKEDFEESDIQMSLKKHLMKGDNIKQFLVKVKDTQSYNNKMIA